MRWPGEYRFVEKSSSPGLDHRIHENKMVKQFTE
jgi:hypothetical protein